MKTPYPSDAVSIFFPMRFPRWVDKILPGRLAGIFSSEDFSATSRVTEDRKKTIEDVMLTKIFFPSKFFSHRITWTGCNMCGCLVYSLVQKRSLHHSPILRYHNCPLAPCMRDCPTVDQVIINLVNHVKQGNKLIKSWVKSDVFVNIFIKNGEYFSEVWFFCQRMFSRILGVALTKISKKNFRLKEE